MRAIVLVGGEGTRLRPLTWSTPKQMLPIVEVPMIARVLAGLARFGVDSAVLSLGYRPDAFRDAFPDGQVGAVPVEFVAEPEPLDTAGAVRYAAVASGIDTAGESFVAVNGDVLTDLDLGALVELHRARSAEATIALTPVEDPSRFGIVVTDADRRVECFVEKPPSGTEPGNLANAGTYVLEPSVVARIPAGRRVSIERETFPAIVSDGRLYALASDAYWLDTGTPAQYLASQLDIVAGRRPGVEVPASVEIRPGVHVAASASVEGLLEPPCYVGAGASVAAGAIVRNAVVSSRARVHAGALVTGSVLLAAAEVGEGCVVKDSILGPGAVLGSGASARSGTVLGGGEVVPAAVDLVEARLPAANPG